MPYVLVAWAWVTLVGGFVIYSYSRMPPRVLIPMILSATLASAFITGIPRVTLRPAMTRRGVRVAITIFALLLGAGRAAVALEGWVEESRAQRQRTARLNKLFSQLHAFNPRGVFVHWPPAVLFENLSLFSSGADLPDLNIIGLGWPTHSPTWADELEALEIDDIYTAIARREDTYLLVSPRWPFAIRDLTQFLKDHRGISVELKQVCINLSVPRPRRRTRSHESAEGVCHGKEKDSIVFEGVEGGGRGAQPQERQEHRGRGA